MNFLFLKIHIYQDFKQIFCLFKQDEMEFVVVDEKNTEQSLIHSKKVLNKTPMEISNLIENDFPNGNINHTFTLV